MSRKNANYWERKASSFFLSIPLEKLHYLCGSSFEEICCSTHSLHHSLKTTNPTHVHLFYHYSLESTEFKSITYEMRLKNVCVQEACDGKVLQLQTTIEFDCPRDDVNRQMERDGEKQLRTVSSWMSMEERENEEDRVEWKQLRTAIAIEDDAVSNCSTGWWFMVSRSKVFRIPILIPKFPKFKFRTSLLNIFREKY